MPRDGSKAQLVHILASHEAQSLTAVYGERVYPSELYDNWERYPRHLLAEWAAELPKHRRGRPKKDHTLPDAMLKSMVEHIVSTRALSVSSACRVIAVQRQKHRPISWAALRQRYYRARRRAAMR